MAIVTKRYLVNDTVSEPWVVSFRELESIFMKKLGELQPGKGNVTIANYADLHLALIKEHNNNVEGLFLKFVVENKIAEALSSNDLSRISFDNFFGWDIALSVYSPDRLIMEVHAANKSLLPFEEAPDFLLEINDEVFKALSGQDKM